MELKLNYGETVEFDKIISICHMNPYSIEYIKRTLRFTGSKNRRVLRKFSQALANHWRFCISIHVCAGNVNILYSEFHPSRNAAQLRVCELWKLR